MSALAAAGEALLGDRVAIIAGVPAFVFLLAGSIEPSNTWRLLDEPERSRVRMRGTWRRSILLTLGGIAAVVFVYAVLALPMAPSGAGQ